MNTKETVLRVSNEWHALPPDEVTTRCGSDGQSGLSASEAEEHLKRYGPNVITARRGKSPLVRFLLQFHNPLLYILLLASIITFVLKDPVDAAIIFGAVLVNVILGYIQESRAEKAIEALARTMTMEATVVRDGKTICVPAASLVPGDLVLLQSGDKVPADMRLIRTRDLQIAEAALTGESVPVEKHAHAVLDPDTTLADRVTMAYASTLVTYGQGGRHRRCNRRCNRSGAHFAPDCDCTRSPDTADAQDRTLQSFAAVCHSWAGGGHLSDRSIPRSTVPGYADGGDCACRQRHT
jgi:cation-transporting ATPase F